MNLSEITKALGLELGGEDIEISRIEPLESAVSGDISFLSDSRRLKELSNTKASAVFIRSEHLGLIPAGSRAVICADPYLAFAKASAFFASPLIKNDGKKAQIGAGCQVSDTARIGQDTIIGKNCTIMAGVYIGDNVVIGEDTTIYPNVVIYNRTRIGSHARIHAGAVIGSDGFGYARDPSGEHVKIRHLGRVTIEDNVEIGANAAIDRAALGETIIRRGAKIDNLVHIAHGCEIGERSLITAQVGFAGGVKTGKNMIVGGQSGFNGHIDIADNVMIGARSGVTKSLKKGGVYAGFPAIEHNKWLKLQAFIMKHFRKHEKIHQL